MVSSNEARSRTSDGLEVELEVSFQYERGENRRVFILSARTNSLEIHKTIIKTLLIIACIRAAHKMKLPESFQSRESKGKNHEQWTWLF